MAGKRLNNILSQLNGEQPSADLSIANCGASVSSSSLPSLPDISDGPATLKRERAAATFDIDTLITVLDGSETLSQLKTLVGTMIEGDEVLNDKNRYDLSRPEARIRTMSKIKQIMELKRSGAGANAKAELELRSKDKDAVAELDKDKLDSAPTEMEEAFYWAMSQSDSGLSTRMGVHFGLFATAIAGQATPELKNKVWDDVQYMRIIGCFAMTELGHGSYIRGFETTSTFDLQSQEFIINSPTLTSTKWWIGMAGQTATHTIAFARLLLPQKNGELRDYGVHSFFVPLRCPETGRALPGIRIGDCGAKMGRNGLDNGWIQFHHVRIPRENMLMRWAQVSPDGSYFSPPKPQLSYGALISGRVSIIAGSAEAAKKALTIAIRYSAIRRQFPSSALASGDLSNASGSGEMQILDYQSTQNRLIPLLAGAYAFHFTSVQMKKHFNSVQKEMHNEDFELSSLNTLHATSAGLKAFSTWWANSAIEQCRQSLGGQGYSAYSGLASLLADFAVMCTWEGDNTVLAQQTARYLLGAITKSKKGEKMDGFTAYLAGGASTLKEVEMISFPARSDVDLLNPHLQLLAHQRLSIGLIVEAARRLEEETKKHNGSASEGWNEVMVDLVKAARAHCHYYIVYCFAEAVRDLENNFPGATKAGVATVLKKLSDLFALSNIENNLGDYLEMGYFNSNQAHAVRTQVRLLCKEIRKEAVPLVDAFNFNDFLLNSPLGAYDGDIYKNYFNTVLSAPNSEVTPYWNELIKPLVTKQQ